MKKVNKERTKTLALSILVIGCFLQVGILWYFQNYGLPFHFYQTFLGKGSEYKKIEIGSFFVPYRIVASEGFDEAHFVLRPDDKEFQILWNEAQNYIKDIFIESQPVTIVQYDAKEWAKIAGSESFIFEFRSFFSRELIQGFLNVKSLNAQLPKGILRMVIFPDQDINNHLKICIHDGEFLFQYKLKPYDTGISKTKYEDILHELKNNSAFHSYGILKELFPDAKKAPFEVRPDIPIVLQDTYSMPLKDIRLKKPEFLRAEDRDIDENKALAARLILGNDKDSYDQTHTIDNTIILRNVNHLYRIYQDAWMEYQYLSESDTIEKSDELKSFTAAVNFLSSKKSFLQDPEIVYLGTKQDENGNEISYRFGYSTLGYPIELPQKPNRLNQEYAIEIVTKGNRVVYAAMFLANPQSDSNTTSYSVGFAENIAALFEANKALDKKSFSIEESYYIYQMPSYEFEEVLKPAWVLKTKERKQYVVPLQKSKL